MNGLNNVDITDREYLLAPTDDLIRFGRSKIKVTAGRRGGKGIHVDAGVSKSTFYVFTEFCSVVTGPPTHSVGGQTSNGRWRLSSSVTLACAT